MKKILVATALAPAGDVAIRRADELALKTGAELAVCHVLPGLSRSYPLFPQLQAQRAGQLLDLLGQAEQLVRDRVRELTGRAELQAFIEEGSPHGAIVERATAWGADLVVIGARDATAIERLFLGQVAESVVTYAPCSVLVARPERDRTQVVAGTDLTDPWLPAVTAADEEARRQGARLTVVHSISEAVAWARIGSSLGGPASAVASELAASSRHHLEEVLRSRGILADVRIESAAPERALVDTADQLGADLLVVASRERGMLRRALMGSVSERVARTAACSVLAVRGTGAAS